MKKVIVKMKDDYANIPADELSEENGFIRAWYEGRFVGAWDMGIIEQIYLVDKPDSKEDK